MSTKTCVSGQIRHLRLWIYLLPVIGVIPAIWTLYRVEKQPKTISALSDRMIWRKQQQKFSRLAINLALAWLSSYCLLSFSAANFSGIVSFRLLYINAIITTGYFITCFILMYRLKKKPIIDDFLQKLPTR